MRPAAGEQLVGEGAKRVDVGRGRDRLAAHLLGRRVLRRHRPAAEPRQRRVVLALVARIVQDLGDAEVEQLDRAVGGDERVRRLEIAMDDEVLVRVLDAVADRGEEREALPHVEGPGVAVGGDRLAGDVLHCEVGPAVAGGAAVEEPRDVGVLEPREDLPLAQEALEDLAAGAAAADQFQGDLLLELPVGALREEDATHAAAPESRESAGTDR